MPRDRDPVSLDPGSHADPGAGRCLMEHVSVLAGEPFRAWPRCTHPAVAALATQVNDGCSPEGRRALLLRADALTRADSDDPALTWRLVGLVAQAVLARRPGGAAEAAARRRLARARRWARCWTAVLPRRAPRPLTVAVALAALDELVAALHALLAAAGPPSSPERDTALVALLDSALDLVRGPVPDGARPEGAAGPVPDVAGRHRSTAAPRTADREELCA